MQRQELLTTLVLANACKEGELRLGGSHDAQGRANARQVLAPRARHASTTAIGGLHQHGKRPEVAVGDDPGGVAYARLALFRGRLEYHRMSHGGLHYSPCVSMPAPL
jgi:hypothetical protein